MGLVNPVTYYMTEDVQETSACLHARIHADTNALSVTPAPPTTTTGLQKRPRRRVWFTSLSSNSGSAALPQILSVVVRRHVIDVNLVAFL